MIDNMPKHNKDTHLIKPLHIVSFIAFLAFAFYASRLVAENDVVLSVVQTYGYTGILVVSTISGFNLVVPVPISVFIPVFVEAGFMFWKTVLIVSIGMTIGDSIGYFIGRTSGKLAQPYLGKQHTQLQKLQDKYHAGPLLILFLYASFAPAPNELIVLPLAFMGYHARHMLPLVLAGNFIFNTIVSFGYLNLFEFIRGTFFA